MLRHGDINKWTRVSGICLAVFVIVAGLAFLTKPVAALSNIGPDPNDQGALSGDLFAYTLNTGGGTGNISTINIPLYFQTAGNKTVIITGANLCISTIGTKGNYRDDNPGGFANGDRMTQYSVPGVNPPLYGNADNTTTCKDKTITMTIPSNKLNYQADINRYTITFTAQVWLGRAQQNRFEIKLEPTAIAGYSSASAQSYGIAREKISNGFRKYKLPFAPNCGFLSAGSVSVKIYDDDNYDPLVQGGRPAHIRVWYQSPAGSTGYVTFTGSLRMNAVSSSELIPAAGNSSVASASFMAQPGYKYQLIVDSVYYVNVLQFQLPFDSIYYAVPCVPPPSLTCNGTIWNSVLAAGWPNTLSTKTLTTSSSLSNPPPTLSLSINGPGGPQSLGNVNYTRSGMNLIVNPVPPVLYTPPSPGAYTLTWKLSGGSLGVSVVSCSQPISAGDQPFLSVQGGDIVSGGSIKAYNQDGISGGYSGAGAQLAALAGGDIAGFVTGRGLTGGVATNTGSGLAFANTTKNGTTKYGGNFAALPPAMSLPTLTAEGVYPGNPSGLSGKHIYSVPAGTTISGLVAVNSDITLIAQGDIYLGDIGYSYNSIGEIPRLTVYATGHDIVVLSGAHTVHGVFITSKGVLTGTGGNFYTCGVSQLGAVAKVDPATSSISTYEDACHSQLTVYGVVEADKILLGRTMGSWVPGRPNVLPAETFQYSPEVWLHTVSGKGIIDSYVSLPPVL